MSSAIDDLNGVVLQKNPIHYYMCPFEEAENKHNKIKK
jgi:uncharacterized protein YlaI